MKRARIEFLVCYIAVFWTFAVLKLTTSIDFRNGWGMWALLCSGTAALALTHWRYERVRINTWCARKHLPGAITNSVFATLFIGLFPPLILFPLPSFFLLWIYVLSNGMYFDTKPIDPPPPSP